MRASGFNSFTSPESIVPRNHFKNANRFSAAGKVSADQLLSAYKGTLREFSSARISTVPAIGPASISSYRPNQASINSAACGCTCFSAAQASANGRPASCSSFHDCVHTEARNSSIASLSPSKSLRYKYRGSQSISTPPRSNTAIERPAISRPILADRSGPFEVSRGPAHGSRLGGGGFSPHVTTSLNWASAPEERTWLSELYLTPACHEGSPAGLT